MIADARDPEAPARAARLHRKLVAASRDDFLPVDRFFEIALYDPEDGYYARERSPFGAEGDYYTAAGVHPLFGRTLARRLLAVLKRLDGDGPVYVVEAGPGDGRLAAAILPELGELARRRPIRYDFLERSSSRAEETLARLGSLSRSAGIPVHPLESVGALGPFRGVVVANEFLDALPVRRLRRTGSGWVELGLRYSGERWTESEGPPATHVPGVPLPDSAEPGTVLEVTPAAEGFVREVADHLVEGAAILVDYAMDERELLAAHPRGTLAAVRGHRAVDDPFEEPGTMDLSTFVNLDRIRAAARSAGLTEIAIRSQAEALGAWGFPELLDRALRTTGSAEEEVRLRLAAKNLLFGFDRFRVLELGPAAARPPSAAT